MCLEMDNSLDANMLSMNLANNSLYLATIVSMLSRDISRSCIVLEKYVEF